MAIDEAERITGIAAGRQLALSLTERLRGIWGEVLGPEALTAHADFFALGGQSLLATQLIARVQRQFGVRLTLRDIFAHPTVETLAERISTAPPGVRKLRRSRRTLRPSRPYTVPLAPAQESYWRVEQAVPGSGMFNQVLRIEALGELVPEALVGALNDVVARQDVLRTTFSGLGAEAVQCVQPDVTVPETRQTCTAQSPGEREELLRLAERTESKQGFDLTAQIPIRLRLLKFSSTDHVMLVTTHHIAFDGWSRQILLEGLVEAYRARIAESPAPPVPKVGYADFAAWQAGLKADGGFIPSASFWQPLLAAPCPDLRLPGASGQPGHRTRTFPITLSAELGRGVSRLAQTESATAFTVLMAAFMAVLAASANSTDSRAALQVANRERDETQQMIGPFANTLLVRAPVDRAVHFRAFLHTVHDRALETYEHQEVPFDQVLAAIDDGIEVDVARLLQVGFALHDAFAQEHSVPDGTLRSVSAEDPESAEESIDATTFELVLELRPRGDGFAGEVTYESELYPETVVAAFADSYLRFLALVVADPELAVGTAHDRAMGAVA